ncbi:cytochrome P450 [Paraglaciecola chathamensis]|uniref:Cytochrome P450 family protein n=1 Tax=Paraglaciecola agarilytica NO2 TaxID=1125747 RepID=A0ABQ0IAQ2_9ALTE|nr:cytochrome P450 [Paraglaciecola agarilytica]GAC06444.1 cytochrome P450 family protein [Paraglaciecola agarilytica NO2]
MIKDTATSLKNLPEFNPVSEEGFKDPALICQRARKEQPVFFYEPLGVWIVTRRDDIERVLTEWETFSSVANSPDVPANFVDRFPQEVMSRMVTAMDPPDHTQARRVLQSSFVKSKLDPLAPIIEARAHEIIDEILADPKTDRTNFEIMDTYCLNLTTKTLMALMDLPDEERPIFEQARDDAILILAQTREPFPEPAQSKLWERYISDNEYFRKYVEARRDSDAHDIISTCASARKPDGSPALSTERIAMHLIEIAFAGTDTTAQAMANAITFLSDKPDYVKEALADPLLWSNVFEETVRRRPSAPFAGRITTKDVELSGVQIPEGQAIWVALASANTDPAHTKCPMNFDIHRENGADHLAFTKGRHTCLGAPLARLQGPIGLRVLYERLPELQMIVDQPLDFADVVLLPIRQSLLVKW